MLGPIKKLLRNRAIRYYEFRLRELEETVRSHGYADPELCPGYYYVEKDWRERLEAVQRWPH